MYTVPGSNLEPSTYFKNEPSQSPAPVTHPSKVTTATPAKRVTFFKSGDAQFVGVRMAIHRRSFKCFDALLDDLSQRVPLPFGVRTITTPGGVHNINHLEQLEDGGCYLCSDRRHVKPVSMETSMKRPNFWHYSHPHSIYRKPTRPKDEPTAQSGQRYHWYPKRIVLVKNTDPAVRRSIILSRRTTRSLRVFLEEISNLMQCHIRKLYTLEGHKIDSIQSLTHSPGVLICVGREPFHPLLVESLKRSFEEKLPGLASRSRSSVCSENQESKKNVNFGLQAKKSIIHPRSDSSNRSIRFSLSSEKSCHDGLNMTSSSTRLADAWPHTQDTLKNDDIEKRVLVNNDGSLSVEMKVRFRLLNEEMLQRSTEIKKSVGAVNGTSSGKVEPHYLQQGKPESCSDPDSNVQYEHEQLYVSKCNQSCLQESHCQNCCSDCKEYDIWRNPLHGEERAISNIRCSRSTASSHTIGCKQASVDSTPTMSQSSEEYTEHRATCLKQTLEDGDRRVEYCTIGHCCSHGEVCARSDSRASTEVKCECQNNDETSVVSFANRSSQKDHVIVRVTQTSKDRPISVMSNSSKILEALKENNDDEGNYDDDLLPSISRASSQSDNRVDGGRLGSIVSNCSSTTHISVCSINHLPPRPPNKPSICSTRLAKSRYYSISTSPATEFPADLLECKNSDGVDCAKSAIPKELSICRRSNNSGAASSPISVVPGSEKVAKPEENDSRKTSILLQCSNASKLSKKSNNVTSLKTNIKGPLLADPDAEKTDVQDVDERPIRILSKSTKNSETSNTCPLCGGHDKAGLIASESLYDMNVKEVSSRAVSSVSVRTNRLTRSLKSESSIKMTSVLNTSENITYRQWRQEEEGILERSKGFMSAEKMNCSETVHCEEQQEIEGKALHTTSATINTSSRLPKKSDCNASVRSSTQSNTPECLAKENVETERTASATSARANGPAELRCSNKCQCVSSQTAVRPVSVTTDSLCDQEAETALREIMEMDVTAMSASKSISDGMEKSRMSNCTASDGTGDMEGKEERVSSVMANGSETLERSKVSVSQHNTPALNNAGERAASTQSVATKGSWKSNPSSPKSCNESVEIAVSLRSHVSAPTINSDRILYVTKNEPKSVTSGTADESRLEPNREGTEERPKSRVSLKSNVSEQLKMFRGSNHHSSESISTPTKTLHGEEQDVTRVKSVCRKTPTKCELSSHFHVNDDRIPLALLGDSARKKASSGDVQPLSRNSSLSTYREKDFENEDAEKQEVSEYGAVIKKGKVRHYTRNHDCDSVHVFKKSSRKDTEIKKSSNPPAISIISQNCLNPSRGTPEKNKSTASQRDSSHENELSYSRSVADLLKERSNKVKTDTAESKCRVSEKTYSEVTESYKNVSDKGGRCRHQKNISSSWQKKKGKVSEIVPSSLPNASPTEFVHDWLKKIPTDSSMYDTREEFPIRVGNIRNHPMEKVIESPPKEFTKLTDETVAYEKGNEENEMNENDDKNDNPIEKSKETQWPNVDEKRPASSTKNREVLPKSCQSSVQIMKVLLSPKLDRCNSLPEVSPVYGRKLSDSAKGLLDCLANLQLIDIDPAGKVRDMRYKELMNILQSLWLCDPSDSEKSIQLKNHRSVDDPKSSSGVDISSGSAGSGKGSDNDGVDQTHRKDLSQSTGIPHIDPLQPLQEETELTEFKKNSSDVDPKELVILSDLATPDIAMRVQGSPGIEEAGTDEEKQEEQGPDSNETIRSDGSPKEIVETPSTSQKSSGNDGNTLKLPDETDAHLKKVASCKILSSSENTKNKRVSKDPDPVWVLNLLKKLEKQFMTHYVNAMTEFKARWDLGDSVMLDTMINELRDEVSKRIQSSINREVQKIQSRAGRQPRPPMNAISRESSAQTEQRRRRLKVMHDKSINESRQRSDDNYTATGTDFSDQRSDDEYCPCETCVKRKMVSRLVERKEHICSALVMTDFDLRKILQLKKEPMKTVNGEVNVKTVDDNGNHVTNENLVVLQEETEGKRNEENKVSKAEEPNDKNYEDEQQVIIENGETRTDEQDKKMQRAGKENEDGDGVETISRKHMDGNQPEENEGGTVEAHAGDGGKDSEEMNIEGEERGEVNEETEAGGGEPANDGITEEDAAEDTEHTEGRVVTKEDAVNEEFEGAQTAEREDATEEDDKAGENVSDEVAEGVFDAENGDEYGASEEGNRAEVRNMDNENVKCGEVCGENVFGQDQTRDDEETRNHVDNDSVCFGRMTEECSTSGGQYPEPKEGGDVFESDDCDKLKADTAFENGTGERKDGQETDNDQEEGNREAAGQTKQDADNTQRGRNENCVNAEADAKEGLGEDSAMERSQTENCDVTVRGNITSGHSTEAGVVESETDSYKQQLDIDMAEDISYVVETLVIEEDQKNCSDKKEQQKVLESGCRIKRIAEPSFESQPGSIEVALNEGRKLKDTVSLYD